MRTWMATLASVRGRFAKVSASLATLLLLTATCALAQPAEEAAGQVIASAVRTLDHSRGRVGVQPLVEPPVLRLTVVHHDVPETLGVDDES